MAGKTYRIFSFTCYDKSDTLAFDDILIRINNLKLKYFYIKHLPESDEKKEHYHFVLYFSLPTTISHVSSLLNIADNNINVTDSKGERYTLKKSVGYLLHYNNNEKTNYNYDDFVTNIPDTLKKYYDLLVSPHDERSELCEILAFIEDNHIHSNKELLKFCIDNNLLKTYRKYAYTLRSIIYE